MYSQGRKDQWIGRIDSLEDRKSFRYHQVIKTENLLTPSDKTQISSYGLIGFECEEGVRRNNGRLGAKEGPNAIKQAVAKLPFPYDVDTNIYDFGNVVCDSQQLEKAQVELGDFVSLILDKKSTPIILGGGHETLYGHYLGVRKSIGKQKKLGIINIDAHFDLRSYDEAPSSGTMFKQILDQDENANYLCLGIQKQGNTASLFETASKLGVTYILEETIHAEGLKETKQVINNFIKECDVCLLTLCMDAVNSAYAPGVSAPSPFGLTPFEVREIVRLVTNNDKTVSFDISEVNPSLDRDGQTSAVAAQLVSEAISAFHRRTKR